MIETIDGRDTNMHLSEKGRIAQQFVGLETEAKTFAMDKQNISDMAKNEAISKFNDQVEEYRGKLEDHNKYLQEQVTRLSDNFEKLEIKPLGNYVMITPFSQNPFQKIKQEGAIITDLGGLTPIYKSQEDGQWHEEESFIQVGTVVEVGPDVKWLKIGDAVMWTKPTELPIPFYKQGLVTVCEFNIKAVVNEGLQERFDNIKNPDKFINVNEIPECLGDNIADRIKNYTALEKAGLKITNE